MKKVQYGFIYITYIENRNYKIYLSDKSSSLPVSWKTYSIMPMTKKFIDKYKK